jgi:NAD(P)-dependent dehydrogenase (short-subunit alcohol dehydrogenase family)
MSNILEGKVVVVTGAASGIGRAIAIAAAQHGARAVVVSDIGEAPREGGTKTTVEIEALGVPTRFVLADVSKRQDNDALIEAANEFGGVDVMVCNAGITAKSDGFDVSEDDYHRLMSVNLDGTLFGAQAAARQMKASGKVGSIVLMASMGGISGAGFTVAYSTSKGGVVLMAKAMADALGPDGIRVNAVCPGTIDTHLLRTNPDIAEAAEGFRRRTPLRRLGKPSEIADSVAWLGSDMSSYVTGIALLVDGGLLSVL